MSLIYASLKRAGVTRAFAQNFAPLIFLLLFSAQPLLAQTSPQQNPAQTGEVEHLRDEVQQLRGEVERLRTLIESAKPQLAANTTGERTEQSNAQVSPSPTQVESTGAPQRAAAPESTRIAVANKAQGGDLAGAGNLLRTDRITIGGYGDAQLRGSGINERGDGGGTLTFSNPRFVLGVAAVLSERHNIFFNSEIEYEFAGSEVEVEQAFAEWKVRPEFAFRGGIFVPALGRFNVYHDSNLNLTVIRPLLNQFIVPTAYSDAGLGVRGRFKLQGKMKLSYEFDIVNGMRGTGEEEEEEGAQPFSRLLGQAEAAEIGHVAMQDNNRNKAIVGRLGFSPFAGLEFGVSGYRGRISDDDDPGIFANILFFDASFRRGGFLFNAEYARSKLNGAEIPRRSPAPPAFDPNDEASADALAEFLAQPTPGQDGFYIESSYQARPRFVARHFDEGGYIAPVVRYEVLRMDRTLSNFFLNRSRTTLGLNIAPASTIVFKLNYLFNHTFGPVPRLSGEMEEEFGRRLLPFRGYGRDGFSGSITYVF
ncbi:MAG: hypothetical protein AUG51_15570 [Acidobacteria bacterium 13_1_20CM_3_53_8]|nr:MAG: hypothetical protein AUG51_15570 [Acidobacteria bacterium 13_1_20CM_3_53_8]